MARVRKLLIDAERACTHPDLDRGGLVRLRDQRKLAPIVDAAKGALLVDDKFWGPEPGQIPCRNGVLVCDDGGCELRSHSPDYHLRWHLTPDYVKGAQCPRFLKFLQRALPDDDVELLQRVFGSFLLGQNKSQTFTLLLGQPQSGKGVLVNVLTKILGASNVATLRTGNLEGRFELGRMVGKLLVYGPDVPENFLMQKGASALKAMTGEDPVSPEYKNSNVSPPAKALTANILITSNSRLKVYLEGDRGAWERRMIVIPFTRDGVPANQRIAGLDHILVETEGPGILNWMFDGFAKFMVDEFQLKLNDRQRIVVSDLLSASESCTCFIRECVQVGRGCSLTTAKAYDGYIKFCTSREWQPSTRKKFERDFKAGVQNEWGITQRNDLCTDCGVGRGWSGIRLCTGVDALLGE